MQTISSNLLQRGITINADTAGGRASMRWNERQGVLTVTTNGQARQINATTSIGLGNAMESLGVRQIVLDDAVNAALFSRRR